MIRFVRQYHDRDEYDVVHESMRMIMYDADRLPKTAVRFIEQATKVETKTDKIFGKITEYMMKEDAKMDKTYYYVILERTINQGPFVLWETDDLDAAVKAAKDQYGAVGCDGNHAFVVLRDSWDSGDHTPLVDVQPD